MEALLALAIYMMCYESPKPEEFKVGPPLEIYEVLPDDTIIRVDNVKINIAPSTTKPTGAEQPRPQSSTDIATPAPSTCPAGSRPSGGGGCRQEPTGCPLSENTPMDQCYVKGTNELQD